MVATTTASGTTKLREPLRDEIGNPAEQKLQGNGHRTNPKMRVTASIPTGPISLTKPSDRRMMTKAIAQVIAISTTTTTYPLRMPVGTSLVVLKTTEIEFSWSW